MGLEFNKFGRYVTLYEHLTRVLKQRFRTHDTCSHVSCVLDLHVFTCVMCSKPLFKNTCQVFIKCYIASKFIKF